MANRKYSTGIDLFYLSTPLPESSMSISNSHQLSMHMYEYSKGQGKTVMVYDGGLR